MEVRHWTADASCVGIPIERFTVSKMGDPEVSHLNSTQTVRAYNLKKIDEAVKICNSCPVWMECIESSNSSDLFWTVRGGLTPAYYETSGKSGPKRAPNAETQDYLEYRCKSGRHVGDLYRGTKESWRKDGSVVEYCIECDHESGLKQRRKVV